MIGTTSVQPVEVQVARLFGIQWDRVWRWNPEEIEAVLGPACDEIRRFAASHRLIFAGPPRAVHRIHGDASTRSLMALPIASAPDSVRGRYPSRVVGLPGGKALQFTHTGPYRDLGNAYRAIGEWMRDEGLLRTDADWPGTAVWEEFMDDPHATPESERLTYIYVPIG